MMFIRTVEIRAAVATLAITALFSASQVRAQSKAPDAAAQASPASALRSAAVPEASASPAPKKQTLGQEVKALVAKYTPDRLKRDLEFKKAAALFPDFCRHWEQDLHDRETNNLSKLKFNLKDGFETATYTAYGKVAGCESHQSKDGYSIGKITYEEFIYYLVGKSEDEAKHASPRAISDTRTTEIFRWDNGKWFY